MGSKGTDQLQFDSLQDISFNASNNKLYVVDLNDRIQVLNSDLTFFSVFGRTGSSKGQFKSPCGVACDSTGKVYVSDMSNHRIQVFTAEGRFLRLLGRRGRGKLQFPIGVAVGANDSMVYVSDYGHHHIYVLTSQGEFVTAFGGKERGRGDLKKIYGLAVDSCGVVYVCDGGADCIQVF